MTSEEIKRAVPMINLVERYGIKTRNGFARCPFHTGDRTPSMKIYKDTFYCFACNAHGDIFTFYQKMEDCDFKTAFIALGGEYENPGSIKTRLEINRIKQKHRKEESKKSAERDFFKLLSFAMMCCSHVDEACEPFSDNWCYIVNQRDWLNYCYELKYIEKKEINEVDVIRVCREVRKRFFAIE